MAAVQSPQGSETLLPPDRQRSMGDDDRIDVEELGSQAREPDGFSCVVSVALLFFLCNFAVGIYNARDDPRKAAFVTGVSVNLIGLFAALGAYDRAPPEDASRRRQQLRVVIWALATTLNFAFAYRVAATVPTAVSLAIWGLAAFVALSGLWLLAFGCRGCHKACGRESPKDPPAEEKV